MLADASVDGAHPSPLYSPARGSLSRQAAPFGMASGEKRLAPLGYAAQRRRRAASCQVKDRSGELAGTVPPGKMMENPIDDSRFVLAEKGVRDIDVLVDDDPDRDIVALDQLEHRSPQNGP